jgi:pimeloyl-ACP methyl ester carboxylesterase
VAKIVLVHGAFNELWGPHEIEARWLPALRDGLWHRGRTIGDGDVAVCFYGDLFRRDPQASDEAVARSRENVAAVVARRLRKLGGNLGGDPAGQALFDRTVDLVTTMATVPDIRAHVLQRIEATVTPETRVIVAHSLGSVVAYEALRRHPEWAVETLVTLGSPLWHPGLLERLDPPVAKGTTGPWPGSVRRWVNVAAVGDRVAAGRLADVYGNRVEEVAIDNGPRAHDPEPYLNAPPTGGAVADALGPD